MPQHNERILRAGYVLALAGAALAAFSTILPTYDFGLVEPTFWEIYTRWDVLTGIALALLIAAAAVALTQPQGWSPGAVLGGAAFLSSSFLTPLVEIDSASRAGAYVGGAASLTLGISAVVVAVGLMPHPAHPEGHALTRSEPEPDLPPPPPGAAPLNAPPAPPR